MAKNYSIFSKETFNPGHANTPELVGEINKADSGNPSVTQNAWVDWIRCSLIDASGSTTGRFMVYVCTDNVFSASKLVAAKHLSTNRQTALAVKRWIKVGQEDPGATWGPLYLFIENDINDNWDLTLEIKGRNHSWDT